MSNIIDIELQTEQGECYQFSCMIKGNEYCDGDDPYVYLGTGRKLVVQPLTGSLEQIADIAEPQYRNDMQEITAIEMQLWCQALTSVINNWQDQPNKNISPVNHASSAVDAFRKYFKLGGE